MFESCIVSYLSHCLVNNQCSVRSNSRLGILQKAAAANPTSLLCRSVIHSTHHRRPPSHLRLPVFRFSSISLQSDDTAVATTVPSPSPLTLSVAFPLSLHLTDLNLTHRHIFILNVIACVVAVSASWLFFSAIPTLLAFKRAAESLEKLLDVTREELPDTMAAVRLSGMEISDLTMELSDLGQEITQGVKSSTRAVRLAEDRLRRMTTMSPTALVQEQTNQRTQRMEPVLARTARGLREGIVKGRSLFQIILSLTRFSRLALNYFGARGQKR
ncbi:uncharacterized protein LOC122648688 [Telopea speciosissima]|uniref:uncharacterized protein LOC122648688 n=1 Tax=Telopea speciosissima TaxID=54955 RepID=UPI001CC43C6B|nr:uncharacterized protein LOC122648688 [Telopea speciosissima]